jgi:hypothetical protein
LISYFSQHICPERFSLTSEKAKKNDFYEVHIYVPDAKNEEISKTPRNNRGALEVKFEFLPEKNAAREGRVLAGKKMSRGDTEFSDCMVSLEELRYSRIDVNYYFGHWNIREQNCSLNTLLKLFILRAIRAVYLSIAKHKLQSYIRRKIVLRRLQTPLKSKYDIYEALMNNDNFLRTGSFRKGELSKTLFGESYIIEYGIYRKVSRSLDWILESCIEDGEIQVASNHPDHDPLYKMKGKGIHYFTTTKETIRTNEANRAIQERQVEIQRLMSWLTVLLVIGTFTAVIDKLDTVKILVLGFIEPLFPYIYTIQCAFI